MYLHSGYDLTISNKKETCERKGQIGKQKHGHDEGSCGKLCDTDRTCNFFYIGGQYCRLFESCDKRNNAKLRGSTFQKKQGNIYTVLS